MFNHLSTEVRCALLAGCVFIFFFTSSVFSAVYAAELQWDDRCGEELSVAPGQSDEALFRNDELMPSPRGDDEPRAGGPTIPGPTITDSPEPPPIDNLFSWWKRIQSFFTAMLSAFAL
jgi:hypothetical protein